MSRRSILCSAVITIIFIGQFADRVLAQDRSTRDQPQSRQDEGKSAHEQVPNPSRKLPDVIELAPIDQATVRAEDENREINGLPPRYAIPHSFQITPGTHGRWLTMDDGRRVWRLTIIARGAVSINLGFTRYRMPIGGQLLIRATDDGDAIRPFTDRDNAPHGQLWTPIVRSDEILVEVTLPDANAVDTLELELTSINYGYRGFSTGGAGSSARSGSCNIDVICPEGDLWRNEIPAIGVISTGGGTFCTGFMVNNTAQDMTPYFMTANHCGIGSGNAASLVVYWNYENTLCRPPGGGASGGPGDGVLNQFNTGSTFRAAYGPSDFTLVELTALPNPAWNISYAGWDATGVQPSSAVGIHHPNTDEKRISFEGDPTPFDSYLGENPPGDGTHIWVTSWDQGTTEPGSSGSPLFDQDHQIVGQLHGGYASCTDFRGDWYGAFTVSWTGGGTASTRLSDWLDAGNTGLLAVNTLSGLGMSVAPLGLITHVGLVGGPFTNPIVDYTLTNPSTTPVNYSVSLGAGLAPLLINGGTSAISGTLPATGGSAIVTVTLDTPEALSAGIYTRDIVFEDLTNAQTLISPHTLEIGQTLFSVTPVTDLQSGGPVGGPFPGTITYTVTSDRPSPVSVQVSASDTWISLNGSTGPLTLNLNGTGDFATVTVAISAAANSLPQGLHNGLVSLTNLSGGQGDTTRAISLDVGRIVYPSTDTPQSIIDNSTTTSIISVPDDFCIGDVDIDLDITHTYIGDLIVELTSPTGVVVRLHDRTGGTTDNLVTTYDEPGGTLPDGPGALADFNLTGSLGNWILTVSDNAGSDQGTLNSWTLRIAPLAGNCPSPVLVYSYPMDTNPGWTVEGQWGFGQPTGGGGTAHGNPDPMGGHTGLNVYGYNLAGDYASSIPEYQLTSTAIDCTGLTGVQLKFRQWLNVESPTYDHAYVRASNDGVNWVTIWQNSSEIAETAWGLKSHNISGVADNQPTVFLRWTMGTTDGSWQYSGWNIDDVEIWGVSAAQTCDVLVYTPADVNLDLAVNGEDIVSFVSIMLDPAGPWTPEQLCAADMLQDDVIDMADLPLFVQALLN